jgi:hypothetical protein
MSFSVKRRAYSDIPSFLSQSSIRCIAARHHGFNRYLTELLDQDDRELIRQIPSIVRRWTKQAKQLSLRRAARRSSSERPSCPKRYLLGLAIWGAVARSAGCVRSLTPLATTASFAGVDRGRTRWLGLMPFRVVRGQVRKHADAPHALALLRACRERPCRRAAEQCDERAPPHSITSSASC